MAKTPDAIERFVTSTNAGDSDAFVSGFTVDAYLNDWGREFYGHEGIRSWDATDNMGVQAHFELLDVVESDQPDTYVAELRVSGNGYNGTGPMTFTLREGLIASLVISG